MAMKDMKMDLLVMNGNIYTMKEEGHRVKALGIRDGVIVYMGEGKDIALAEVGETVDLQGRSIIPGMGDSHMHFSAYCQNLRTVSLEHTRSVEELVRQMKERVERTPAGEWIKGSGFDQTKFVSKRLPTRWDLDKASSAHPMVVRRCCLHVLVANTKAMEMAGMNDEIFQRYPGLIERNEKGEYTGVFREGATAVFDEIIPDPLENPIEKGRLFQEVFQDMVSKGITSIHTYAAQIWRYVEDVDFYREMERNGELPIRVTINLDQLWEQEKLQDFGHPMEKVRMGAYKIFTDGSLGARSAALFQDYSDEPGNMGIMTPVEHLEEKVRGAYEMGLPVAIHAIGDRAMEGVIQVLEKLILKEGKSFPAPCRVIHAQMVTIEQRRRLKSLPVVLDIQPVFLCTDLHWIEDRIGKERMEDAYIWRTLWEEGLLLTGGSDCPVESYNPLKGIHGAVNRQDENGFPPGGYYPQQKLSLYQGFCLFTKNIHIATGQQDVLGTLEVGKFADFVILDRDPFFIEPEKVQDIKVEATYVGGEKVYSAR
jgi:predicted amidohydrolase YtcJ